jgi:type IV secretion system protein VirB4
MIVAFESDSLDLSNRFTAFDFTYVFEDETLAPAVVSYIMNRIQNITGRTGDPSLIIIDETAPMLQNPEFRKNFVIGLQEGRKKRQAYLAAFQQPNVLDKLGIGEVIRGQCQTQIFFRNIQARVEDYESWNLTPKEMAFIQGKIYKDLKYAILFRKPTIDESVILNVDLSGLGPYLQIFNSGRKQVLLVEELRKLHGDKFVEVYLDSVK